MRKNNKEEKYIPKDPLELLNEFEESDSTREVLYTFGTEEVIKEDGKYFLASTKYPDVNKEISMETATEIWQSFNMKPRSDVSVNFDFDHNKFNMF